MKTLNVNHCVHGIELNSGCIECELTILEFAFWLGIDDKCFNVPEKWAIMIPETLGSIN